jgi:hypothetical protein
MKGGLKTAATVKIANIHNDERNSTLKMDVSSETSEHFTAKCHIPEGIRRHSHQNSTTALPFISVQSTICDSHLS